MIVLSSTHNKLKDKFNKLKKYNRSLQHELENINDRAKRLYKIARDLDKELTKEKEKSILDKDTIRTMLSLCHPDKHGGKESATRITQLLLELRKES